MATPVGANRGGPSPGAGDGPAESSLAALSDIVEQVRAKVDEAVRVAGERLGPDAADRLRSAAAEMAKAVGGDRLPAGTGERLRGVAGGRATPVGPGGGRAAPVGPGGGRAAAPGGVPAPPFEERPELYVGAAFAGGVVLAGLLRLLGR